MTTYLNALGVLCSLGHGKAEVAARLLAGDVSAMRPYGAPVGGVSLPVGAVPDPLPVLTDPEPGEDTRNNRLLWAALLQIEAEVRQAIDRFGPARIGVVLGTSTTGIQEASRGIAGLVREGALPADYHYAQQELVAPARLLSQRLQLSGPSYAISTACTSSARALLSARRLLEVGLCDAVLCGGVDSLCDMTLHGFTALEATSPTRCNPFSVNRNGINIGEAAALFLMTREPAPVALLGGGASSDAHHMSAPDPEGAGAYQAMCRALENAGLDASDVDYLNLHGTSTRHNDAMESLAVSRLFPEGVPCSSTKPMTGHTLGAAGALEAAFCWLALCAEYNPDRLVPPHLWDGAADPSLPSLRLTGVGERLPVRPQLHVLSNSFAFGGNNSCLVFGGAP